MEKSRRGKYRVYWASQPPRDMGCDHLDRLIPAEFSTEEDALHAAALVLRAKQYVWCIERSDGSVIIAPDVAEKCAPMLAMFESRLPKT